MNNKTSTRKRSRTFTILYYWGKLLGVNPLILTENNQLEFSYFGLFYGCFLTVVNAYIRYLAIHERLRMALPGDSPIGPILEFIGAITGFVETTSTWLTFAFCQNRVKFIVESFVKIQKTSAKLGIPENYDECLNRLKFHILITNGLYTFWLIYNSFTMKNKHGNYDAFIWGLYFFIRITSYNTGTIFLWSFLIVKYEFRRLNDAIRFVMQKNVHYEVRPQMMRNSSHDINILLHKIFVISDVHRQLRDLAYRIQQHFSIFVLMNVITQLSYLTVDSHIVCRFFKRHHGSITTSDILYTGHISFWIITPILTMTVISNVCGSTSDEANDTRNIIHDMLNNFDNYQNFHMIAQCNIFSLDLLQNQLKVCLLDCINLDHYFVYKTMAAATTYLIIMLQFYN